MSDALKRFEDEADEILQRTHDRMSIEAERHNIILHAIRGNEAEDMQAARERYERALAMERHPASQT